MDYREVENFCYLSIDEMCEKHPEFFEGIVSDYRSQNLFKTREKTKLIIEGCTKITDLNLLIKTYEDMERFKNLVQDMNDLVPGSVPDNLEMIPATYFYPQIKKMVATMLEDIKPTATTS